MQIREIESLSHGELVEEVRRLRADNDELRRQLVEQREQEQAIGAGGVDGRRLFQEMMG